MRCRLPAVFLLAFGLPLAARAAALPAPPAALDLFESCAEDTIDHAARANWSQVHRDVRDVTLVWAHLRGQLAAQQVPDPLLKQIDQRVVALADVEQSPTRTPLQVEQKANAVTAFIPDLQKYYKTPVPPQIARLDYLGRQILLDRKAGDPQQAAADSRKLVLAWQEIRPSAHKVARRPAQAIDRDVALISAVPVTAQAVRATRDLLDRVDQLESGFAVASSRSAAQGGGAGPRHHRGHHRVRV